MALVWFVPGSLAAAFGISPPWIVNENLKPGSSFVYVIDLNTNDPAVNMKVKTTVTGDQEILDWVKVRNAGNLMMPKGEQHYPMYVELNVPPDATAGSYSGDIGVTVEPTSGLPENEVAILLGGHVAVNLDVVNYDVTDYWVKSIGLSPTVEGKPILMDVTLKNLGNTPISKVDTNLKITDYNTGEFVTSLSGNQLGSMVYPHTVKQVELVVPTEGLESGEYWANVNALKNGQSIYENRLFLEITDGKLNNTLQTAVNVALVADQPNADAGLRAATADRTESGDKDSSVSLKTTVTVRAPLTNQLIGLVIVLMIVLIVITGKIYGNVNRKRKHRR